MRKTTVFIFLILSATVYGQTLNVLDTVKADRNLASGHERAYDFNTAPLTAAPEGYKPFYISHYGRHGSRYAWDVNVYTAIRDALSAAHEAEVLTEEGKKLYESYMSFCDIPIVDYGCIVPQGWEEQRRLGERMHEHFPEVFADNAKVYARASTSQRSIVSMNSFTLALQKAVPSLDIRAEVLTSGLTATKSQNPDPDAGPFFERGRNSLLLETRDSYMERKLEFRSILDRLFTSDSFFKSDHDRAWFCLSLYYVWSGYRNYCDNPFLENIFTSDETANLWEVANYKDYKATVDDHNVEISRLMEDIVERADKAIKSGEPCADLRFGHDIIISMMYLFMNVNRSNVLPQNADDVKLFFQNWRVPMASNVQFVFYRSEDSGNVLVKMLMNEEEVFLPDLKPVSGPYYKWRVLRKYMLECSREKPADFAGLEEDVNIGYGTVKKKNLTGAVGKITVGDNTGGYTDIYDYLRGKVAGLEISGSGDNVTIRIRGERSFMGSNEPLILVDGMERPYVGDIPPATIKSVEILKDASSTSAYGSRGANGVILITLKK